MAEVSNKVLLMGVEGSGKTSMRSIIFCNYIASDTGRLSSTVQIENSSIKFLGNLSFNLWDCGGQEIFVDSYLSTQKAYIFTNVEVLLFVFDCNSKNPQREMEYYTETLKAIAEFSPDAKVFCFIHKVDLLTDENRDEYCQEKQAVLNELTAPYAKEMRTFKTSIWNETLYRAWTSIVYSLNPNAEKLKAILHHFGTLTEATEVILFEKATFLVIAHSQLQEEDGFSFPGHDPHRFEKISNVMKRFKLSCLKINSQQFQGIELKMHDFHFYIQDFTANSYIMVIMPTATTPSLLFDYNLANARKVITPFLTQ